MILTDTHSHIYSDKYDEDIEHFMDRAFKNNIKRIFVPNINYSTVSKMLKLTSKYPNILFPMIGLHPCYVDENFKEQLDLIKQYLKNKNICAIGEIGIDLYWDKSLIKFQKEAFIIQLNWATKMKIPVVIHCRNSFNDIYEILISEKYNSLSGVFHCFTGSLEQANKIIDLGFYLGIGGVVTFKNSGLDKVLEKVDIRNILLETDSPYLAPSPFRGKLNESSYLYYIAKKISEIYNIDIDKVANITTNNSVKLFKY